MTFKDEWIRIRDETCYRCGEQIKPGERFHTLKYDNPEKGHSIVACFCEKCAPTVEKEIDRGKFRFSDPKNKGRSKMDCSE